MNYDRLTEVMNSVKAKATERRAELLEQKKKIEEEIEDADRTLRGVSSFFHAASEK